MAGEPSVVPTVSFRIVDGNPYASEIVDLPPLIKSFGYIDPYDEFERPEHYIRHIGEWGLGIGLWKKRVLTGGIDGTEPMESDLAKQVEYDMDEQGEIGCQLALLKGPLTSCCSVSDREWLEAVNEERRKEQSDKITYEFFEILVDRLEKEWFDLVSSLWGPLLYLSVS